MIGHRNTEDTEKIIEKISVFGGITLKSIKMVLLKFLRICGYEVRKINRYQRCHGDELAVIRNGIIGSDIVNEARAHLEAVAKLSDVEVIPTSRRWTFYINNIRKALTRLETYEEFIRFSQQETGFDNRGSAAWYQEHFPLYASMLKNEFPQFSHLVDEACDSPLSTKESLMEFEGRVVSNILFYHLRYMLKCLSCIPKDELRVICDIGGGYGGPARLWLQNSYHQPDCYILVDFPECLIFAEIFLRANFDDMSFKYVISPDQLDSEVISNHSVIFCPIQCLSALAQRKGSWTVRFC